MTDGGEVNLETGFDYEAVRALMGHGPPDRVRRRSLSAATRRSCCDAEQGVYYGASESRKDGHAAGY